MNREFSKLAAPVLALAMVFNVRAGAQDIPRSLMLPPPPASVLWFRFATTQPAGYADWCRENLAACEDDKIKRPWNIIPMTPENWHALVRVNERINKAITYKTDQEHYHKPDHWTLPQDGEGDCEDYAMLKEKILIEEEGFDPSSFTKIVLNPNHGEEDGHLVLAAWTTTGVYILDLNGIYPLERLTRTINAVQMPFHHSQWHFAEIITPTGDIMRTLGANTPIATGQRATPVLVPQ